MSISADCLIAHHSIYEKDGKCYCGRVLNEMTHDELKHTLERMYEAFDHFKVDLKQTNEYIAQGSKVHEPALNVHKHRVKQIRIAIKATIDLIDKTDPKSTDNLAYLTEFKKVHDAWEICKKINHTNDRWGGMPGLQDHVWYICNRCGMSICE